MISRNLSSDRLSPPLASGWWRLTSSLKRALISTRVAPSRRLSVCRLFRSSGLRVRRSRQGPRVQRVRARRRSRADRARATSRAADRRCRWLRRRRCLDCPKVGADLPGRPVAGEGVLLEVLDLARRSCRRSNCRRRCTGARDRGRRCSTARRARAPAAHDIGPATGSLSTGSRDAPRAPARRAAFWARRGCCRNIWSSSFIA